MPFFLLPILPCIHLSFLPLFFPYTLPFDLFSSPPLATVSHWLACPFWSCSPASFLLLPSSSCSQSDLSKYWSVFTGTISLLLPLLTLVSSHPPKKLSIRLICFSVSLSTTDLLGWRPTSVTRAREPCSLCGCLPYQSLVFCTRAWLVHCFGGAVFPFTMGAHVLSSLPGMRVFTSYPSVNSILDPSDFILIITYSRNPSLPWPPWLGQIPQFCRLLARLPLLHRPGPLWTLLLCLAMWLLCLVPTL